MFALIDCNNFYASCERLFRPDLRDKPIVVLSNNDGCAIARSNEAKALGIKMGDPYFQIKDLCTKHQVQVFSSNYTLYGDLSQRVMSVIQNSWPEVEIYSIDEAFLHLKHLPEHQHTAFCEQLQKTILKVVGIPTSIGIGKTKTLAKLANHIAKKRLKIPVFNIHSFSDWLDKIDVEDIWGVGRRWSSKLRSMGIQTAGDLSRAHPALIKKRFNVVLQRTLYELRGLACLELEEIEPKQSIVSSKSFGIMQTDYHQLAEAISAHVASAWGKLRQQHLVAQYLSVFVLSNKHRKDLDQYSNSLGFKLINPSDDIRQLTKCAKFCLKRIYKPGVYYKKAGVLLDGLIPKEPRQIDLFNPLPHESTVHSEQLMKR
ncbi:UmuC [Legionella israelensis]|uniref:UmuC n=1 Tax=Legionella israelensis TaxID=454 RepID=A0A0W0V2N1_9GAMM|nr:UmuC [Legionella israelensis]SCY53947.1 DNA polymerase V [Legionella israelensis DSM 19235]STX59357.1 UmuC [Legionella israelensis]